MKTASKSTFCSLPPKIAHREENVTFKSKSNEIAGKNPGTFYDEWLNKKLNLAAARQRWKCFALRPLFTCH